MRLDSPGRFFVKESRLARKREVNIAFTRYSALGFQIGAVIVATGAGSINIAVGHKLPECTVTAQGNGTTAASRAVTAPRQILDLR